MPNPAKIHANLAERMQVQARALAAPEPMRIIVQYRAGTVGVARALQGLITTHRTYSLIAASADSALPNAINTLSDRDEVEMIWFDEPVHTMLDVSVPLIGAPQVWQAGITGKDIKVAIVDTGIDPNHPDFANRIAQMKDFTGQGPADNHGHGTHVAGIIGGTGAGSSAKYRGVAPDCLYYTAKVLRGDGSGSTSDVMAGVEWAVQQGAQVINLSLGSDGACDGTDALSVLCDTAVGKGVVMCIAAGNAGPGASTVGSPGCAKSVITIGATTKSDQIASFSSRGPTSDGRVKPDVCFPGANIVACRASGTSMGTPVNELYTSASGTSMATPHAAGTCALLLQAKPGLAPQQVKDLLMNTAKDLGLDANTQGKGRAQAFAAYQSALGQTPEPQPPTPTPPGQGCWETIKSVFGGR
jgi:subtilisin family serine protease